MNKIYISVPLIALLIFSGFYFRFSNNYEKEIVDRKIKAAAELKAKLDQEVLNREIAGKQAIEMQAKRKLERDEKERIDEAKKLARIQADEKRVQAFDERRRLRDQVERLKKDLTAVQEEVGKNEEIKKSHNTEIVFLKDFVRKIEASQKDYYDLLDKIAAADAAAAKAAADALLKKS